MNEDKIILTKCYANKEIEWVWGEAPDKFNFQDFIGLTPDEVKIVIPDIKEKEEKAFRRLDYYELNLLFNDQGFCVKVEYLRPKDPKWPYKTHGVFPLENSYTESKMLKLKGTKKIPSTFTGERLCKPKLSQQHFLAKLNQIFAENSRLKNMLSWYNIFSGPTHTF